jgi:hypothetical protein
LARADRALVILAPIWERFFATLGHIFCNLLIFYSVARRQAKWFWLAFGYKTLIDAVAAYALIVIGKAQLAESLTKLWSLEAIVAVWGFVAWLGIRWLLRNYPVEIAASPR